jgi:hypothetical protein
VAGQYVLNGNEVVVAAEVLCMMPIVAVAGDIAVGPQTASWDCAGNYEADWSILVLVRGSAG